MTDERVGIALFPSPATGGSRYGLRRDHHLGVWQKVRVGDSEHRVLFTAHEESKKVTGGVCKLGSEADTCFFCNYEEPRCTGYC